MTSSTPRTIHLKDYTAPHYLVDTIDLTFNLNDSRTEVDAVIRFRRNGHHTHPVLLYGVDLQLKRLAVDGKALRKQDYGIDGEELTIPNVPDVFTLNVSTVLNPAANTSLEGLYKSENALCTQCEAEGFRKITFYPDRPDVMARFTTTLIGSTSRFPVLLSNGNAVERGTLGDRRHWVKWVDPYPKPAYLFAVVAGDLACLEDVYTTASGRRVQLQIYCEHHNRDKCGHAMQALKKAMRWDEEVFNLEYDLDIFMIVAVDDFNMGAMENKGLNIFNSKYVLADPQTATDEDYAGIESVIAHEYFHNWTGNRVTCRDWFQLSLKEGLTVFRDQEFSADTFSRAITRIQNVRGLRSSQFPEDAGPMAHPVRPSSYMEINNFYTATIYNKGAEIIRMLHTVLGHEGFRRGMDLYFERHDGKAVTTDDFVDAMAAANDIDLGQFKRWYEQAGTPTLTVSGSYEDDAQRFTVDVEQSCPDTPGQSGKLPFHLPFKIALFSDAGQPLACSLTPQNQTQTEHCLNVTQARQRYVFEGVAVKPTLSALRDFSAPVKLSMSRDKSDLAFLAANDNDPFNRWDAGQELASQVAFDLLAKHTNTEKLCLDADLLGSITNTLKSDVTDRALIAESLVLPSEAHLGEQMDIVDVEGLHTVRQFMRRSLAEALHDDLVTTYRKCQSDSPYQFNPLDYGRRRLKNQCLSYLMELDTADIRHMCLDQFLNADNMTDVLAAFQALCNCDCEERLEAIEVFMQRWGNDSLSLDKWFSVQATSHLPGTLNEVERLLGHRAFNIKNPNKVRSLISAFCFRNQIRFHEPSGSGYVFLADKVLTLDEMNPQMAARLLGALARWRKFDQPRQALMRKQLERIASAPKLSSDTFEIASKTLKG